MEIDKGFILLGNTWIKAKNLVGIVLYDDFDTIGERDLVVRQLINNSRG